MKVLLPLLLLTACLPDKGTLQYSLPGQQEPVVLPREELYDFKRVQADILGPKCAECHKWATDEAKVLSRIVPGNPEGSRLFRSVESGRMPKDAAPLSTLELEMLRSYINSLLAPTLQ